MNNELPEPAAHMYPSDLEKFKTAETFATAYSVAVGNPDERSVPVFNLADVVDYANRLGTVERDRILEAIDNCPGLTIDQDRWLSAAVRGDCEANP